jgi:hypothetical protein
MIGNVPPFPVLGTMAISLCREHQFDAGGQRTGGSPDGIDDRNCSEQHKRRRAETIISTEKIEHKEHAAED